MADSIVAPAVMTKLRDAAKVERSKGYLSVCMNEGIAKSALEKVPDELSVAFTVASRISPTLAKKHRGNPRQIKRFMNTLMLRKRAADRRYMPLDIAVLAKLMIVGPEQGAVDDDDLARQPNEIAVRNPRRDPNPDHDKPKRSALNEGQDEEERASDDRHDEREQPHLRRAVADDDRSLHFFRCLWPYKGESNLAAAVVRWRLLDTVQRQRHPDKRSIRGRYASLAESIANTSGVLRVRRARRERRPIREWGDRAATPPRSPGPGGRPRQR
jgi:hypothetical protein